MKKLTLLLILIASVGLAQTGHRKPRKDKGGHHKHSAEYSLKKSVKETKPKKSKK